jgi:hypothetical protein
VALVVKSESKVTASSSEVHDAEIEVIIDKSNFS